MRIILGVGAIVLATITLGAGQKGHLKIHPDGGMAFPGLRTEIYGHETIDVSYPGLSMRDYFAAAALIGMSGSPHVDISRTPQHIAEHCYRMADAMLDARQVPSVSRPQAFR